MESTSKQIPNWRPLEANLAPELLADFMHMGQHGTIQLYKHRDTRRYLYIDADCVRFFEYRENEYEEIDPACALVYVFS